MNRVLALLWLGLVLLAAGYLGLRVHQGLAFRTDLMALLPREEQNPGLQQANDTVTRSLSARVLFLVGAPDREAARGAAGEIGKALGTSGLVTFGGVLDKDRMTRMGRLYFPYRRGLLSEGDRRFLLAGDGQAVATEALSQIYGFAGMTDAGLIRQDPFLLLQHFFMGLPLPQSHLSPDDGMLSLRDGGMTWILLAGTLNGPPFALKTQNDMAGVMGPLEARLQRVYPGFQLLRLGAVFFAAAGAKQSIGETSTIGLLSTAGTILLVILAFRALSPLWLTVLTIAVGVLMAFAGSFWIFGELHVAALLFGTSLIGVSVDYSLQYCTEIFTQPFEGPGQRLRRVLGGVTLGTTTTIIGYLTLLLAPFPGLREIAVFSVIGLAGAWATVVLWLPMLDRSRAPRHGQVMLRAMTMLSSSWEGRRGVVLRRLVMGLLLLSAATGLWRLHVDDDVRHMQSLSPPLVVQQERMQHLIGSTNGNQFFLVEAPDDETALEREETLIDRLQPLLGQAMTGFQAPAQYVPSAKRQRENRALVHARLDGALLDAQVAQLGLSKPASQPDDAMTVLSLREAMDGQFSFLSPLIVDSGSGHVMHVVSLDGARDFDALADAATGISGVRLVDPAGDFSVLLGKYRSRAIALLLLSAALMLPFLALRYGFLGGLRVMAPPLLAVAATPALRALGGGGFSFFDAMGLVLVLSIGVDYAVFCAETSSARKPVTMLAVTLAAGTAILSFGLLACSGVAAVHAFGSTMLIGILLAYLLAPMARPAFDADHMAKVRAAHWARLAERGSCWGLKIVALAYTVLGRRGCMALLWPIVAYFHATDRRRRQISMAYLARIRGMKGEAQPGWLDGLRHFMSFAEKALDAFIAWSNPSRIGPIRLVGTEAIEHLSTAGQGGILIVSHLGNVELCRPGLATRFHARLNVLMHTVHARHYNRLLQAINPEARSDVVEVTELGPETAALLDERVQNGEWLAIAGDRAPVLSDGRVAMVSFLGTPAPFSQGPYILASLLKCPVYLLFCLREGYGHVVHVEHFADRIDLPRRARAEALQGHAQAYAHRLQAYCLQAPEQWYNFYDFWAGTPQPAVSSSDVVQDRPDTVTVQ